MKLLGLVGTNSARSTNRKLLQYIEQHFADKADIELVEIKELPIFNKPANRELPEIVKELVAKIEAADGVIIGTPEYDHSIPAVLMNALAWVSYGVYPLLNKPVMITGASYGTHLVPLVPNYSYVKFSTLLNSRPLSCQMNFYCHIPCKPLMLMGSSLI